MRRRMTAARSPAGAWLLAWGGLVFAGAIVNGCVDKFVACGTPGARSCHAAGGEGGDPIVPIPEGGDGGVGGVGGATVQPSAGMAGMEPEPSLPPCKKEGVTSCLGEAQSRYTVCERGFLREAECEAGLLCDNGDGKCKKAATGCEQLEPGAGFCSDLDVLNVCGPDLVTVSPTQCEGACIEGACQKPTCGDGKLAEGEACDDANTTAGDGCSPKCNWEPIRIDCGAETSCALFKNGDLKCWGSNEFGQLGIGDTGNRGDGQGELGPNLQTAMTEVVDFAVGGRHVCAAASSGGIYCWGDDSRGQLGRGGPPDGATVDYETRAIATVVPATTKVISLTAGDWHTCALLKDQRLYCWGGNTNAQLGIGLGSEYYPRHEDLDKELLAVDLKGAFPRAISAGQDLTCALLDTQLRCWGANGHGQTGVSSKGRPVVIPTMDVNLGIFPVANFAVGQAHVCARSELGQLKCWGSNSAGQLGYDNSESLGEIQEYMGSALAPVALGQLTTNIYAGVTSTCGTLVDGKTVCWGSNRDAALGRPVEVGNDNFGDEPGEMGALFELDLGKGEKPKAISMGGSFGCALLESGKIKCWGSNKYGQLGLGDVETRGDAAGEMGDALPYAFIGEEDPNVAKRER